MEATNTARRTDRMSLGKLAKAARRSDGAVGDVPATAKSSRVLAYPWGREYAPPDELARPVFLESFRDLAVTIDHPLQEDIGPSDRHAYQVGHVSGPARFDAITETVVADLVLTDAAAIAAVDAGELVEVSLGYGLTEDRTPGKTPSGEPYDLVQRDLVANHVALLGPGGARGGPVTRLRLDSKSPRITAQKAETMEEQIKTIADAEAIAPGVSKRLDSKATLRDVRLDALEAAGIDRGSLAKASDDYVRGAFDAAAVLVPAARGESTIAAARMDAGQRDTASSFGDRYDEPSDLARLLHNI